MGPAQIGQGFPDGNQIAAFTLHALFSHVAQTRPRGTVKIISPSSAMRKHFCPEHKGGSSGLVRLAKDCIPKSPRSF